MEIILLRTGFVSILKNSAAFYKNFLLARLGIGHQIFFFLNKVISVFFYYLGYNFVCVKF